MTASQPLPLAELSPAELANAEELDDIAARLQPRLDESDAEWVMSTFIAPLFGNGDAADLAEVLAKHRSLPLRISWAAYPGCSCGWLYPADSHGGERLAAFEQHRANALLPVVEARVQAAANQREAETLIRLADAWDENASRWYYEHRHTHPNGIGWVGGFEEGWCEAARLLRARAAALVPAASESGA